MERGVLIFAAGKSCYGEYAYNLAASIKFTSPTTKIHLIYWGENVFDSFNDSHKTIFDSSEKIKDCDIIIDGKFQPFYVKTLLNKYSPFEETLFIDADSIFLPNKKIEDVFSECKNKDFNIQSNNVYRCSSKFSNKNILLGLTKSKFLIDKYNLSGVLIESRSQLIYFKKSDICNSLFNKWNEIYLELISYVGSEIKYASNYLPDEIPLCVAINMCNMSRHFIKNSFCPIYVQKYDLKHINIDLFYIDNPKKYLVSSIDGKNFNENKTKIIYNEVVEILRSKYNCFNWNGEKVYESYDLHRW